LDLSSVVGLAVDALRPEALKRNVTLEVVDAPDIRVFGDVARLQQVFWNLLSNAIKFTPGGGRVRVQVAEADGNAIVRVEDNGTGIAGSLLPFVFDRFRQGDARNSHSRGLGLGLALVRELVQAHKGTVTAESPGEGLGSTFTVRLPPFLSQPLEAPESRAQDQEADLTRWHPDVLVVDDEVDARDMLALMLEARGATVRSVGSAGEAVDAMTNRRPDVLLADVGMAVEDGYALIRRWRLQEKEDGRERVTAIAVTAYASATDRERALKAGYDGHIAKPVDAGQLIKMIAAMLGGARSMAPDARRPGV
jgi:CheY-like chemotaxis protein